MTGGRPGGAAGAGTAPDDPSLLFGDDFGERGTEPDARRVRRRGRRLLAAVGTLYLLSENIGDNVQRVPDVFGALNESSRPPQAEALTFLLVGTDSRSAEPTTGTDATGEAFVPGVQRSDVLMIARIEPDRTGASVVSIPRDSWVEIPGRGFNKINAAYSFGGPACSSRPSRTSPRCASTTSL